MPAATLEGRRTPLLSETHAQARNVDTFTASRASDGLIPCRPACSDSVTLALRRRRRSGTSC